MMFFPYLSLFLFFFSANMNRITQNTHTHTQIAVPCHHILSTIFREQIVLGSFLFRIDLFLFLRILYLTLMMIREGNCSSTKNKTKQKNFLVRSPLPNLPWSLVYTSKGIFTTPKTKTKTKKFFFRRIQRRKEQQRNKMIITITARLKKTRNDDDINYLSLRLEIVFSILS